MDDLGQLPTQLPAMAGLGGAPMMATPAEQPQPAPVVEGPATTGPANPGESVARHIMAALGGSDGKPLDWAKGILSGGLAAAANVGKAPEGAGFLYGASRGAQGVVELNRQNMLDKQRLQQQQFENQEKLKADARAEKALANATDQTKSEIAMHTAQTAGYYQKQNEEAEMFPTLKKEQQLKVQEMSNELRKAENDNLSILAAGGIKIEDLEHITNSDQLTESHAKQAGAGDIFPVPNGEEHKAGEDKAGAYIVPGDVWDKTTNKPVTITSGWDIDPKTGAASPKMTTVQPGTKVGTLLAIARGAQQDLANKKSQIFDQAKLEHERAGTQSELASAGHQRAETAKTIEETKQLKEWDIGGEKKDAFGNPVGAPGMDKKEYVKRVDTYNKDYSKDLNQLDAARSQLTDIIKNAEATGKLPGADAVVGIFDAIGLSSAPLKGRGFRINNQVVGEHVEGTRNAWQGAALKLSRLTPEGTGQIVSLQQLKDYQRIMDQARHDAYVGAGNDAVNRGIGIQNAPRGNGNAIDANTMDIFLTMAHGDPKVASSIAKQYGWTPPQ